MTERSRDQYRDGHKKSSKGGPIRWVGQIYVLIVADTGTHLVGTWWDFDAAEHWAGVYQDKHPQTRATAIELEFKDYWLPPRYTNRTEDVPTGDLL
jgi:hypothetical protein